MSLTKKSVGMNIFILFFLLITGVWTIGMAQDDELIKPTYLSNIQELAWAAGSEAKVFVDNNKLFIPLGAPGLAIYDISDPENPTRLLLMHSTELGGQAGAVAANGEFMFVATPITDSIIMLDITDPSQPIELNRFGGIPSIKQLCLHGNFLYVHAGSSTNYRGGVYVYDVSNESPTLAGQYLTDLIDPGFYVTVEGVVFLARTPGSSIDSSKIDCVDMSDPSSPTHISQWSSPYAGNITDIDLRGNRLYCSAYWGGLWILDATDFSNLTLMARFDWNLLDPYAISVKGRPPFAFLAQGGPDLGFNKFDIFRQDGASVSLEDEIPAAAYTHSVYLKGEILILIEMESPWLTSNPHKILHLYNLPPWSRPDPPVNIALRRNINRSLFIKEAFHTITWDHNSKNNELVITNYRIYRKNADESDAAYQLIGSVSGDTFEYVDDNLEYTKKFQYVITSVESRGYESENSSHVGN